MKNLVLLLILTNIFTFAYSQVIMGTIKDQETDSTILFASIYINGTFIGTTSDVHGNFQFDISKNSSMPITISCIGYYSRTISDYPKNKAFIIYLFPKTFELQETRIPDKSLVRKRRQYLRLFKQEFLGTSQNARDSKILNEDDIKFNYGTDEDTLRVFSSKPLLIENKGLGYQITYYLDKFEFDKKSGNTSFYGNIIFNHELDDDENSPNNYFYKRRETYLGSMMHFFRSLWIDDLIANNFKVLVPRTVINTPLKYETIVDESESGQKYLNYFDDLEIVYFVNESYITFLKPFVHFEKNGYFDPTGILWQGEMTKQRIADWLPYEYEYK